MTTELKQKYTEDRIFDVGENFVDQLQESFSLPDSLAVAKLINKNLSILSPVETTTYGGVVHNPDPIFFSLRCVKLSDNFYSFTRVNEIDVDDYLDLINLNSILK